MDLSKFSIFKLNISPISKDESGRDEFHLECIKKIDGKLLRNTITSKNKYVKIDHYYLQINPKSSIQLFNNIKQSLTYKFNNITELNYKSPIQTLQDHYIMMLSQKIFGVPNLQEPFKNIHKLKDTIESAIDEMIYRFLDIETYNNKTYLKELVNIIQEKQFILNFQCIIKPPPELNRYNINETLWNMNVLVD